MIENETVDTLAKPTKETKAVANYRPAETKGEDCLGCKNFLEPDRCEKVRGEIAPTGVCDLWEMPDSINGLDFGDSESVEAMLFGPGDE